MSSILENAKDLGQGIYTQAEVDSKDLTTESNAIQANHGFKNYIINGGFDVWQRGTSSSISGETFGADRMLSWHQQGGTVSKDGGLHGFYSTQKVAGNSAGACNIFQRIEATSSIRLGSNGNTKCTVSIWGKADVAGQSVKLSIRKPNSPDNWSSGYTIPKAVIVGTTTTSFTRYTATFDLDFVYWEGIAVDCSIVGGVTTAWFGGFQLEEGSVATPFEHRPYGLELSLCQRYYEKQSGSICYGSGFFEDTGYGKYYVKFEVEKRTSPSLLSSGGGTFATYWTGTTSPASNSPTITYNGNKSCMIALSGGSYGTDGQGTNLVGHTSDAYLAFDAEL